MNRVVWKVAGLAAGVVVAVAPQAAHAQAMLGAAAQGVGGAYTARAVGPAAAVWNPAALALSSAANVGVTFGSVAGAASTNSVSLDLYNRVSGAYLDDPLKSEIVSAIPSSGFGASACAEASVLGMSIGRFAVTTHASGTADARLPRDLVEMTLYGNEEGRTYSLEGTAGAALATGGVVIATAMPVRSVPGVMQVTAGLSVERILAARSAELLRADGSLFTSEHAITSNASFDARVGEQGTGWSTTFGFAAEGMGGWQAGLVVQSLGSVSFTRGTMYRRTVTVDSVNVGELSDVDVITTSSDSLPIPAFSVGLPLSVRGGVSIRRGPLLASADVTYAVTGVGGRDARSAGAIGVELWPGALASLRAGAGTGGLLGTRFSVGAGLHPGPLVLDVAVQSVGSISSGGARGAGVAGEFGLRF